VGFRKSANLREEELRFSLFDIRVTLPEYGIPSFCGEFGKNGRRINGFRKTGQ
jgi:hypothetical protein